jgi:hypothetical protein
MGIEIVRYQEAEAGARKGFLSARVTEWGLEIQDMALFEKDGRHWVSMPSRKVGEKCWPFLRFVDKERADRFSDAVGKAFEKDERGK